MFGDNKQHKSSMYAKAYNFKYAVPRKRNYLGLISGITLCVLVAIFLVVLIANCPF